MSRLLARCSKNNLQDEAETPGNREIQRGTRKERLWEAGEYRNYREASIHLRGLCIGCNITTKKTKTYFAPTIKNSYMFINDF